VSGYSDDDYEYEDFYSDLSSFTLTYSSFLDSHTSDTEHNTDAEVDYYYEKLNRHLDEFDDFLSEYDSVSDYFEQKDVEYYKSPTKHNDTPYEQLPA